MIKITIPINDKEIELTVEEARELLNELKLLLDNTQYVPYYPYPATPNYPRYTWTDLSSGCLQGWCQG